MESSGSHGSALRRAGGILSVVAGVSQIIWGSLVAGLRDVGVLFSWWSLVPVRVVWGQHIEALARPPPPAATWPLIMAGFVLCVLGILAIIGGVSGLRRKSFGVSLAGAISALPSVILGILAVIFVSLSKREFGGQRKEMGSNGGERSWLVSAGGALSVIAGVSQLISGVSLLDNTLFPSSYTTKLSEMLFLPFLPGAWRPPFVSGLTVFIGWLAGLLGMIAIVGGVSAIRRKRAGLSLAGAICALPSVILGILAIILISVSKREFGRRGQERGI
jgi:hypothetical protein